VYFIAALFQSKGRFPFTRCRLLAQNVSWRSAAPRPELGVDRK
jgi:hypothetical protein